MVCLSVAKKLKVRCRYRSFATKKIMKPRNLTYMFDLVVAFKVSNVPVTFEGISMGCIDGIQNMVKEFKRENFEVVANRPGCYAILERDALTIQLVNPATPECERWSVQNEDDLATVSQHLGVLFSNNFKPTPEHNIVDEGYKSIFFEHKITGQMIEISCRLK